MRTLRPYVVSFVCGLAAASASGQTVGGTLVDRSSNQPLQHARVVLLDTSTRERASTLTDSRGQFMLDAPGAGTYRLGFKLDSMDLGTTSAITLATQQFVQKQFLVDTARNGAYLEHQVTNQVSPYPGNRAPRYPEELLRQKIAGEVIARFVVDTLGRAEMATFRAVRETDSSFTKAVRDVLPDMRFYPAMIGTRLVRQVVQMPFTFSVWR